MNEKAKQALAEYRAKVVSGEIIKEVLTPIEKAKKNPTPMNCIKAKCYECMGAGGEPHTKTLIKECKATSCPLHPIRPYQSKHKENEEN